MSFVLKEMTDEDVQKVVLDSLEDEETKDSSEYAGIVWSVKGGGKKNWVVDVETNSYLFMARSVREQHSFRYFAYYGKHFISLELHGTNDVLITDMPPSLRLKDEEVKSAIRRAFKVHGRWGAGEQGDVFDAVDAQFVGGSK